MIFRSIVFVFGAVALAGCCALGSGCYTPLPGAPIAWDGFGSPPTETAEAPESPPKKNTRPKKEIIVGPIGEVSARANTKPQADEAWEQQEATDRADEQRLTKRLKICTNC
jgi:hypothetical protein